METLKHKIRHAEYLRNRYRNDPEYRQRCLQYGKEYRKALKNKVIEDGKNERGKP